MKWKNRNTVLFVLFIVWLIAYMDRMVMSTAIPYIAKEFNLSPVEMGGVMSAFFAGYALCQIPGGILADKFGARKVMVAAILWWSLFTAVTGMVTSLAIMIGTRFVFGVGEGIFPAASWKAVANWFPTKERGTATAVMLSSNSLGPAIAPLFVVAIMAAWGWRPAFYLLFIPGVVLCYLIWRFVPDNPAEQKGISNAELEEIQESTDVVVAVKGPAMSFWDVIKVRAVWQSFLILLFFNITAWGFMAWLPSYLVQARGLSLMKMGIAASLPFFAGAVGFVLGGWLSDNPFKQNRKIPFIISAWLCAFFLYLTYTVKSIDELLIYQTTAGFILMTAAGALWSLPMSAISKEITGRGMGIVNTAGQLAAFLSPIIVGFLVQISGSGARSFDLAFMFLIGTLLMSSLIAMTFQQQSKLGAAISS